MDFIKKDERVVKPEAVKIAPPSVSLLTGANQVGNITILFYGLGDDQRMYKWDAKEKEWVLA